MTWPASPRMKDGSWGSTKAKLEAVAGQLGVALEEEMDDFVWPGNYPY